MRTGGGWLLGNKHYLKRGLQSFAYGGGGRIPGGWILREQASDDHLQALGHSVWQRSGLLALNGQDEPHQVVHWKRRGAGKQLMVTILSSGFQVIMYLGPPSRMVSRLKK